MSEQSLMAGIRTRWGALIDSACHASSVPAAFLAALIANESGGNPLDRRYEPKVLGDLWQVFLGRAPAYGSLQRADLLAFLGAPATTAEASQLAGLSHLVTTAMLRLDGLATSQGLTQVMGYNALAFHLAAAETLQDPPTNLNVALRMLADFAQRFGLDLAADFEALFDCWNTGRPNGKTFDPNYVANGIARMQIYAALPGAAEVTA